MSKPEKTETNPMLDMAITYLLGLNPERRLEIVNSVCDTLGVRPDFWRKPEVEAPPVNVPCILRTGTAAPWGLSIGAVWDGSRWMFGEHAIEGVNAFALIPD